MSVIRKLFMLGFFIVLSLPLVGKAEISPLKTVLAMEEEVLDYRMLDGYIEAVNKSTVSAQTSGVVSKLFYDVGDYVEKDALLARISSETQKSSFQQAQAAVSEAKASISSASASVVQAEAATREATANYNAAKADFDRIKGLFEKNIISRSQFEQTEAVMKSSLARVESARARLNAAKAGFNAARSGLISSQAELSKAGEQLAYTEVVAPYSGIVTERHVELGEVVFAGKPIMTGISLQEMRAVTDIPQRMIQNVRKYNSAQIYPDGDEVGINAEKLTIFPYADTNTNAFKVRASLKSAPKGLFPGVFVKIGFVVGKESQLVIPVSAVAYRSEVTGVYILADDLPVFRQVRVGREVAGGKVRILAGLDAGEEVAVDPVHAAMYLKQKLSEKHGEAAHD